MLSLLNKGSQIKAKNISIKKVYNFLQYKKKAKLKKK
jgi:hypothetical protein